MRLAKKNLVNRTYVITSIDPDSGECRWVAAADASYLESRICMSRLYFLLNECINKYDYEFHLYCLDRPYHEFSFIDFYHFGVVDGHPDVVNVSKHWIKYFKICKIPKTMVYVRNQSIFPDCLGRCSDDYQDF